MLFRSCFFALLHSSADKTKIYEFHSGGILPENPLESVSFQGKKYFGRKKSHSVHELTLYLEDALRSGLHCFFEDVVHHRSDPIQSEMKSHALYFHEEVYFYINKDEFDRKFVDKIIHYTDAEWYYMNIISEKDQELDQNITSKQLQRVASKASHIIVGAYDMEGFLIWKKS